MPNDEFDEITDRLKAEGMSDTDPTVENAIMAAQQVGAFYAQLKAFHIPDQQAEYLTRSWLEISAEE